MGSHGMNPEGPHRLGDILEVAITKILEFRVEFACQSIPDLGGGNNLSGAGK